MSVVISWGSLEGQQEKQSPAGSNWACLVSAVRPRVSAMTPSASTPPTLEPPRRASITTEVPSRPYRTHLPRRWTRPSTTRRAAGNFPSGTTTTTPPGETSNFLGRLARIRIKSLFPLSSPNVTPTRLRTPSIPTISVFFFWELKEKASKRGVTQQQQQKKKQHFPRAS